MEFARIEAAAAHAEAIGLECHAGHGLTYDNVAPIAAIKNVVELINAWAEFQRNFIYLNSIFCLEEIQKALPDENKFFL